MIRISHQILNHFTNNGHVNFFHILFTLKNEEWLHVRQRTSDKLYDQAGPTNNLVQLYKQKEEWPQFRTCLNRKKNGHSLELV